MHYPNTDSVSDALLLLQVAQGNKNAFSTLYGKYWKQTFSSAFKRLKDRDQAKDIVQDIFTSIWMRRESLHIDNLPAYLNVAVRNRVFKAVEKQRISSPFLDTLHNLPSALQQADSDIHWREFYTAFEELLLTLPPKRQIIFRLRFQQDLTPREIAARLEISKKTVHNQLGKAIHQMRTALMHLFVFLIMVIIEM
jgi:RNA polymerase sigma-70 factor (ECF subfamily)